MKKGLSILLIAAALFGFYGGATSLNDVLASKDYWEKEGEKSTADMNKLEDGLHQLADNKQAYLDGLDTLAEGEQALEEGKQTLAEGEAAYAAAPGKLRAGEVKLAAGKAAYKSGKAQYDAGKKQYNEAKAELEDMEGKLNTLKAGFKQWSDTYASQLGKAYPSGKQDYKETFSPNGTEPPKFFPSVNEDAALTKLMALAVSAGNDFGTDGVPANLQQLYAGAGTDMEKKAGVLGMIAEYFATAETPDQDKADKYAGYAGDMVYYLTQIGLDKNRRTMKDQIMPLLKKMAKDEEIAKKLEPKGGVEGISQNLEDNGGIFIGTVSELITVADSAIKDNKAKLAAAKKQLDDAEKQLAAGKKQIKKGEADLAQGYADYAAAPAKLAAGRQALADGLKQIEDGKKKLAEYEDGEQQVRDGLATLMSTEPDGGLESILDRRNGDDNFDDAQGHLDVDEGLDAVEVGRGYQADSGELITKEITGRAVGTAAGLGAAVLAVLAAILSFAKKYKGAAVSAILAAVAGCAGALVGNNAGDEFSNIAGSTVGATPWIAAGVLAAVALVFAIAHFTAKPEA